MANPKWSSSRWWVLFATFHPLTAARWTRLWSLLWQSSVVLKAAANIPWDKLFLIMPRRYGHFHSPTVVFLLSQSHGCFSTFTVPRLFFYFHCPTVVFLLSQSHGCFSPFTVPRLFFYFHSPTVVFLLSQSHGCFSTFTVPRLFFYFHSPTVVFSAGFQSFQKCMLSLQV